VGNGLEGGVEVADDGVEPDRHPLRHVQGLHRLGAAVAGQELDGQLRVVPVEVQGSPLHGALQAEVRLLPRPPGGDHLVLRRRVEEVHQVGDDPEAPVGGSRVVLVHRLGVPRGPVGPRPDGVGLRRLLDAGVPGDPPSRGAFPDAGPDEAADGVRHPAPELGAPVGDGPRGPDDPLGAPDGGQLVLPVLVDVEG